MKTRLINYAKVSLMLLIAGCAGTHPMTSTGEKYSEDLSEWRLPADSVVEAKSKQDSGIEVLADKSVYVPATHDVNDRLYPVLDSIDRLNLAQRFVDGYSIQVYLGIERNDAFDAKKQFALDLPRMTAELRYDQPNYQVKSGKYFSRLEAQKDYLVIRHYFPSAIIIPDKIPIPQ